MRIKFTKYEDPGHGWLKVKLSELSQLGLTDKITPYSMKRRDAAYLEEDVDMPLFVRTYHEQHGYAPIIRTLHTNKVSKIRNYPSYTPETACK